MSYDDEIIEDSGLLNQDQNEHMPEDDPIVLQQVTEEEEIAIFEDGFCPHCGQILNYGICYHYDDGGDYMVDEYTLICHSCRMMWGNGYSCEGE